MVQLAGTLAHQEAIRDTELLRKTFENEGPLAITDSHGLSTFNRVKRHKKKYSFPLAHVPSMFNYCCFPSKYYHKNWWRSLYWMVPPWQTGCSPGELGVKRTAETLRKQVVQGHDWRWKRFGARGINCYP